MLAEKLNATNATTKGRQQGDPKALGVRPTGVNGLSYVAAEAQPRASYFLGNLSLAFLLSCFLLGVPHCIGQAFFCARHRRQRRTAAPRASACRYTAAFWAAAVCAARCRWATVAQKLARFCSDFADRKVLIKAFLRRSFLLHRIMRLGRTRTAAANVHARPPTSC